MVVAVISPSKLKRFKTLKSIRIRHIAHVNDVGFFESLRLALHTNGTPFSKASTVAGQRFR